MSVLSLLYLIMNTLCISLLPNDEAHAIPVDIGVLSNQGG